MTKTHTLHQTMPTAQATTSKGRQLPVRRGTTGCLIHHRIHLVSLHIHMIPEQGSISLHHISGMASTLHLSTRSVWPPWRRLLNLANTPARILPIRPINTLLPPEATVNTISHRQMHIVYHHHFPVLAIHIHHPTMRRPKRPHPVSERQSHASTVARER